MRWDEHRVEALINLAAGIVGKFATHRTRPDPELIKNAAKKRLRLCADRAK